MKGSQVGWAKRAGRQMCMLPVKGSLSYQARADTAACRCAPASVVAADMR